MNSFSFWAALATLQGLQIWFSFTYLQPTAVLTWHTLAFCHVRTFIPFRAWRNLLLKGLGVMCLKWMSNILVHFSLFSPKCKIEMSTMRIWILLHMGSQLRSFISTIHQMFSFSWMGILKLWPLYFIKYLETEHILCSVPDTCPVINKISVF